MLKKLVLRNFQSHESTEIELSPGVNAVVGKTDSGKSAIIRAIYLVAENKPSGTSFIRNGATETEVVVELDDGVEIARRKGSGNSYSIDEQVYSAVGVSVPSDIAAKLAMDSDIAFQKQSSPYFLLHATPTERGKLLDEFSGMSIAGNSVAEARRVALRHTRQVGVLTEQLAPKERHIEALDSLHSANYRLVDNLKENIRKREELNEAYRRLEALGNTLGAVDRKLRAEKTGVAAGIESLEKKLSAHSATTSSLVALERVANRLSKAVPETIGIPPYTGAEKARETLAALQRIRSVLGREIPPVVAFSEPRDTESLRVRGRALWAIRKQLVAAAEKGKELATERARITGELAAFKVCPLCASPLKERV